MTENIVPIATQGSDLEGSAQPADSKAGRSDPAGILPAPKKFPLILTLSILVMAVLAALSIYLFFQTRAPYSQITASPIPSPTTPVDQTIDDTSTPPSGCIPTYQVETNTPELTAKQNYAMECTLQRSKEKCLKIDIYNQKADDFSIPDKISDCIWKEPIISVPTPFCGTCPQLTPPAPGFCTGGTVVPGKVNSCGCSLGPECIKK